MSDIPIERHEWKRLPEPLLVAAVKKATGNSPGRTERLLVSYSNDVYEVETRVGSLIVRAHRGEIGHFEREGWALDAAASVGCPVPEVLTIEDAEHDGITWSLCVQRRLPGVALLGLFKEGTSVGDHQRVIREAGECLARVHSVVTSGFGYVDGRGVASPGTWEGFHNRHGQEELAAAARTADIDPGCVVEACEVVNGAADLWADIDPHLAHADFSSKHVLVDGDHVSGIIDFEFASSDDAARDLAFWDYQEGPASTAFLLEGYRAVADADDTLERRADVLRLLVSLDYLSYHAPRGELTGSFRDQIAERLPADLTRARP